MAKKKKPEISELERALTFLAISFDATTDQSRYALIQYGIARSFNMVIGLGAPLQTSLDACPHLDKLLTAIQQCGINYAIIQLSETKLRVGNSTKEFHAFIDCYANPALLSWPEPDPYVAPLSNSFIVALTKVAPFVVNDVDKAPSLLEAAIQLYDASVLATNRSVVIEAWHGHSMPDGLLIPKITAKCLKKAIGPIKSPIRTLIGFGFSEKTITFYFDDHYWLRSQLFQAKLPDIRSHIEGASIAGLKAIPHDFFNAVSQVAPFSDDGYIYVSGNKVSSHRFETKEKGSGLALEFTGELSYRSYKIDDLAEIQDVATQWDENGRYDGTVFFGDKVRGMIWHGKPDDSPNDDEDIPF